MMERGLVQGELSVHVGVMYYRLTMFQGVSGHVETCGGSTTSESQAKVSQSSASNQEVREGIYCR